MISIIHCIYICNWLKSVYVSKIGCLMYFSTETKMNLLLLFASLLGLTSSTYPPFTTQGTYLPFRRVPNISIFPRWSSKHWFWKFSVHHRWNPELRFTDLLAKYLQYIWLWVFSFIILSFQHLSNCSQSLSLLPWWKPMGTWKELHWPSCQPISMVLEILRWAWFRIQLHYFPRRIWNIWKFFGIPHWFGRISNHWLPNKWIPIWIQLRHRPILLHLDRKSWIWKHRISRTWRVHSYRKSRWKHSLQ